MRFPIAVVLAPLLVLGCTPPSPSKPPAEQFVLDWAHLPPVPLVPVNDPPDAFIVRWSEAAPPPVDPKVAAERHCQAWDGHAELVAEHADGGEFTAEFVCKDVPKRRLE
jgi:hypothetical protein